MLFEGLSAELVGDVVDLCGEDVSIQVACLAYWETWRRTGKVAGGALATAEALEGGFLDLLAVLAALAIEVGKGAVGLGDRGGEALELYSRQSMAL